MIFQNLNIYDPKYKKVEITNLYGSSTAFFALQLLEKSKRDLLFVSCSSYEASKLSNNIQNNSNNLYTYLEEDILNLEQNTKNPEIDYEKIEILNKISQDKNQKIISTNIVGLLRYIPEKNIIINKKINLTINMNIEKKELIEKFYKLGYRKETLIDKTGDYSERGFIVEIFPISFDNPIRIEFFDNIIEKIRYFDVDTQLSINEIDNITINACSNISFENSGTLKSYLNNPIIIYNDYDRIISELKMITEDYLNDEKDITKIFADLDKMEFEFQYYITSFDSLNKYDKKIDFNTNLFELSPGFTISNLNNFCTKLIDSSKKVIITTSKKNINYFIDLIPNTVITNYDNLFEDKINLVCDNLDRGFILNDITLISENNLFSKESINKTNTFRQSRKLQNINKIKEGDYVVHIIHGIGIYKGIQSIPKMGILKDYMVIEYRNNDKLYVPANKITNLSKYSDQEGYKPIINRLGSNDFEKAKNKIKKKIEYIANDLIKLYAEREAKEGISFDKDTEQQIIFENEFDYDLTKDQKISIQKIKEDMEKKNPMDRLLCGDVGFGKTEVAFRAIFKAIMSCYQVAYLCPTTILSNQHFKSAIKRFEPFGIRVEVLNRFVSTQKKKQIIEGLQKGYIDLIIGTHRILSDDVKFKKLGLLIVDEEQRFGVKHKEKIKSIKTNIDVLSLSATPIPRTMQMSIVGIRDLSLIETPPKSRLPIKTYVLEYSKSIIRNAIYKELARKGQIFILFNDISNIENIVYEIKTLVSEIRIDFAHGRQTKTQIENKMNDFVNYKFDCLVCTTIIETGIDIPNANTLIILNADRFGLSQLYQIRGRVGRGNKEAHCYLFYSGNMNLTDEAMKRLKAIKEFTELGAGFAIAMRDLSIRGAGDILGKEQAGFVSSVGIELYLKMVADEVKKLKGEKVIEHDTSDKSIINVETYIPDELTKDSELKISIHRKINEINSLETLENVKIELEDRFGKISDNLLVYMYSEWFEKLCEQLNINKLIQTKTKIELIIPKNMVEILEIDKLFIESYNIYKYIKFNNYLGNLHIIFDIVNLNKHYIYYLVELLELVKSQLVKGEN